MRTLLRLVVVVSLVSQLGQAAETTFYVATNGNNGWSGKLAAPNAEGTDGPFATLEKARDAARVVIAEGLDKPLTVMVRGGKYYLPDTFLLEKEDSGTRDHPVTYQAYPGEKPILSGGRKITGWKPYKGKILQADVPAAKGGKWRFRQLFLDGKRQIRARTPNFDPENPLYGGWAIAQKLGEGRSDAFEYEPDVIKPRWSKPTEAEVFLVHTMGLTDIVPIKSVDAESRVITLKHRVVDHSAMPYAFYRGPHMSISEGYHFYVTNVLEELDQPGEWSLDSEEGVVYFWPPSGSVEGSEVVGPVLQTLIDISGGSHITISGFTFTETTTGINMHRGGQEGYGAMLPTQGRSYIGDAVHLQGAEYCRIENNHFYGVGGNGVYAEGYNLRNVIRHNEINEAGGIGVCLIGSYYSNPAKPRRYPLYNEVVDNYIHDSGVFDKYVAGVFLGLSESNIIGHNRIENMPHHAINLGNSGFGRNIVEYNEIRNVGRESCDKGAINMWMEDPYGLVERQAERSGHVIRYNLIADFESQRLEQGTLKPCNPAFGIYLDNYTSNSFVYGNIVVRSGSVGIYLQGGKNNIVENNIVVDSLCATHMGGWWQPQMEGFMTGNHFTRNIFYNTDDSPKLIHRHIGFTTEPLSDAIGVSDYNVFFSAGGAGFAIRESSSPLSDMEESKRTYPLWPKYEEIPLEEWRRMGFDTHSVVADPLFVDPTTDDFRLKPDSPALKLGFQPIDQSKIGPREKFRQTPR